MPPLQIQKTQEIKDFKGIHYHIDNNDLNFDKSTPLEILISTNDGKFVPVLSFIINATQPLFFEIFENTTVSANGSEQIATASDRNNLVAALTKFYNGPTIISDGDLFSSNFFNMNMGLFTAFPNDLILKKELILSPNKNYLLRLTTEVNNSNLQVTIKFFEEDLANG